MGYPCTRGKINKHKTINNCFLFSRSLVSTLKFSLIVPTTVVSLDSFSGEMSTPLMYLNPEDIEVNLYVCSK